MHVSPTAADESRRSSIYLIEAQALFVPTLIDVFSEVGLDLRGVSRDADAQSLLAAEPDVVFVDIDFLAQEPVRLISVLRSLLPKAVIYVYTSMTSWLKNCSFPGANAVFSKHSDRQQLVAALREGSLPRPA